MTSGRVRGRPILVAEIGQAHDGSLGTAHAYIDAAAAAGADIVKFQTHLADAESHPSEPWRVQFSKQDATRFDYWKRMEFTPSEWEGLYEHTRQAGMEFMSSPFSIEAVELLGRTGIDHWKIASGEVTNLPLLERIAEDGRPVVISSGMTTWDELDEAVDILRRGTRSLTILQCTSSYPCPPERTGLNILHEMKYRYDLPFGLSDHSGGTAAGIAAVALGARMIEVHITFSRQCFGPDVPASLTLEEFGQLRADIDFVATAIAHPVRKDQASSEFREMRQLFTRSIVTRRPVPSGAAISIDDLTFKKPGTGIAASRVSEVIGMRASRGLHANEILSFSDLEQG